MADNKTMTLVRPGAMIGEYRVSDELGEGGMGIVYSGVHPVIGKRVAIKVLKPEVSSQEDVVERFIQEARAVNQISHANIIDIFSFGQLDDGRSYFVMEYLEGENLANRIQRRGPMAMAEALLVLRQVADAVDAAHETHVIHRDLKPDNIFLSATRKGTTSVKVLDFGIAKLSGAQVGLTKTGMAMGTPLFMSPEQCKGGDIDHRADVYSFGVMAMFTLTGDYPFKSDSIVTMIYQHLNEPPKLPSAFGLASELDPVFGRALAKNPKHRYNRCGEVVAGLEAVASAISAPGGAVAQAVGSRPAPRRTRVGTPRASIAFDSTQAVDIGDALPAPETSRTRVGTPPPPSAGGGVPVEAAAEAPTEPVRTPPASTPLPGVSGLVQTGMALGVESVAETFSGVVALPEADAQPIEHVTVSWPEHDQTPRYFKGHSGKVSAVVFSHDHRIVASAGTDNTLRLWKLTGEELAAHLGHKKSVRHLAFSPDGVVVATASVDRTVRLLDVHRGVFTHVLKGHKGEVSFVAFSPDGGEVASGSHDKTIRLWDVVTGKSKVLRGHKGNIRWLAYSPDGSSLASASDDRTVRLWRRDGEPIRALEGHRSAVSAVAFSPRGLEIASSSHDGTLRVWDANKGGVRTLEGHEGVAWHLAYSPDGRLIASGGADKTVRLWPANGRHGTKLEGHAAGVRRVAFSPDSRTLASASSDQTVRVWDVSTRTSARTVTLDSNAHSVVFSRDGPFLAAAGAGPEFLVVRAPAALTEAQRRRMTEDQPRTKASPKRKRKLDQQQVMWMVTAAVLAVVIGAVILSS